MTTVELILALIGPIFGFVLQFIDRIPNQHTRSQFDRDAVDCFCLDQIRGEDLQKMAQSFAIYSSVIPAGVATGISFSVIFVSESLDVLFLILGLCYYFASYGLAYRIITSASFLAVAETGYFVRNDPVTGKANSIASFFNPTRARMASIIVSTNSCLTIVFILFVYLQIL